MINCYKSIALSFGYVESNTTSWLIYRAECKFPSTRKEAVFSLTEYFWNKFHQEKSEIMELNIYDAPKCCQDYWFIHKYDKTGRPVQCGTCNQQYNFTWEFDEEEWKDFLRNIHRSDCDSYGEHDSIKDDYGWSPWMYRFDVPQNQMVIIGENAEVILSQALFELYPELRDENSEVPHPDDDNYGLYHSDYINLMDESCVLNYRGTSYNKPQNNYSTITETVIYDYPNGAQTVIVNGRATKIRYNTGDEIHLTFDGKNGFVSKIITSDSKIYEYDK